VSTHAGGKAPIHVRLQAPSRRGCIPRPGLRRLSSRAQDPSIRRVYRTRRITVEQRPSSPSASRALLCASRQPRPAPCRALKNGASCPCPLSAAPRASLPFTAVSPREGLRPLDLEDALCRTATRSCPLRDRLATEPSRSPVWSPVAGWTPTRLTFASRVSFVTRPFARSRSVVGRPVARSANSRGIPSLVDSARRCEQRAVLAYSPFGSDPCGPEGPTGASPRARRPVAGTPFDPESPTTRAVRDTVLAFSRARRTFVRRGVLRIASFR